MKTRRSLDISKQAPKKRKQPKRFSLDPSNTKRLKEEEKENYLEGQTWKESGEPERDYSLRGKQDGKPKKRREREREKGFEELYPSLQANNRALATALGEARVQINAVNQENVCLKRQLHCERLFYVERIGKEVEQKVRCQFKAVEDCLQQTICKLLESSKLISSVMDMVSMPTNTTTLTPVACPITTQSFDNTPPPDEPENMEVTTAELVPMETTITELGNIVTALLSKETELDSTHLQDLNNISNAEITVLAPNSEQEDFNITNDDTSETSDDSQPESSIGMPFRKKRRSSTNVSYVMPSLRREPSVAPSQVREFRSDSSRILSVSTSNNRRPTIYSSRRERKGRMSTGCIQKKPRHALTNLTNVIREEQEAQPS